MTDQPTTSSEFILHRTEDSWPHLEGKLSIRQVERTALEVP